MKLSSFFCSAPLAVLFLLSNNQASAADQPFQKFGDYKVYFSVLNSSFISEDIASIYKLTRGADRAIINIAVVKKTGDTDSFGLPAKLTGSIANLMQQQKTLDFTEIKETNATYYLASFRFSNEEMLRFKVSVDAGQTGRPFEIEFTKKLYVDK